MATSQSAAQAEPDPHRRRSPRFALLAGSLVLAVAGFASGFAAHAWWLQTHPTEPEHAEHDEHDHDHDHDHGHGEPGHSHQHAGGRHTHEDDGHDHSQENDLSLVELTEQARGNIGLKVEKVGFTSFTRTIMLPAIVVERPGRSQIDVVAPMTGVVTKILVIPGQSIEPGQTLFEMRLLHEELVQAQVDFLKTLEELGVVNQEIARIEKLTTDGALPGKQLIDRNYEKQKLEAVMRAQGESLALHGLQLDQIEQVKKTRRLVKDVIVRAPANDDPKQVRVLQVERLQVEQGQNVAAGESLCRLADHAELYVEGKAFQQDADLLNKAAGDKAEVCAIIDSAESKAEEVCSLRILFLSNKIDPQSRLFSFFATLPNEIVRDDRGPDGRQFVGWRFRPGQRLQLKVPVETWPKRIVLPVDAVVQDGAESYVFREDGDHFHRCPVRVAYRDQFAVVLAEGNQIYPGDRLALNGAQQLLIALKNKSGGAIDPHAGHQH